MKYLVFVQKWWLALLALLHIQTGYAQSPAGSPVPASVASVEGTVIDADTRRPISGAVITIRPKAEASGNKGINQVTSRSGAFYFRLDPKQVYILVTNATGYQPREESLAFTSSYTNRLYGKQIPLRRVEASVPAEITTSDINSNPAFTAEENTTTQLRSIQFMQSTAELLPEAKPELEQLLKFMQDNSTVEIELAGHTDNQGDADKNLDLSKQRAEVIKQYLVSNGIAAERITSRGYGGTRPIAPNTREETRRLNRRVEMTILKR